VKPFLACSVNIRGMYRLQEWVDSPAAPLAGQNPAAVRKRRPE
jgi:hypothetical protein